MEIRETLAFRAWLDGLRDREGRARIARRVARLSLGALGDVAAVGNGVSELRLHFGPGYRVHLAQWGDVLIVLLCGGDKGSQAADIAKAKALAATWRD